MRRLLRSLPVFSGALPAFDPDEAPADPLPLFTSWLSAAIEAGVPEPHAMTLSTVDDQGRPDARVLILKDVDERGWAFASSAASRKGEQLSATPAAALTAHWPLLGRQVRVRGRALPAEPADSAADFLARSPSARAESLLARQSQVLLAPADLDDALSSAQSRVADDPRLVAPAWTLYRLQAEEVEFWQATPSRRHTRLRYRRAGRRWERERLWP